METYIYQYPQWPTFTWDDSAIRVAFGQVRQLQGKITGVMQTLGFSSTEEAELRTLTLDVMKTSEIEGELLDYRQVRSSIARKLGINTAGLIHSTRHVDGIVEIIVDATRNHHLALTEERLHAWHAALFPTGYSGMRKIEVGTYRSSDMQIVSGAMGRERVHYVAIPPEQVKADMDRFLEWFNREGPLDPVLKAAVAHLWFIIIHPFDDGNGRIARAISDMMLAKADQRSERFYSMSNQIMTDRKQYYAVLQRVQHSSGDITEWMEWFLDCLKKALMTTESSLQGVLLKADFWRVHEPTEMNERQRAMLNRLLDGFEGKLKTSKWAKITKCSTDTALRDIKDLIGKGILRQEPGGGRSTNYELVERWAAGSVGEIAAGSAGEIAVENAGETTDEATHESTNENTEC